MEVWSGGKRVLDGSANDYVKAFFDPRTRRFAIVGIDGLLKAIDPSGRVLASVPLETALDPIRATLSSPFVLYNEGAVFVPAGKTSVRTHYDRLADQYESCFDLRRLARRWRRSVQRSGRFLALDGPSVWEIGATLERKAGSWSPEIFFSKIDLASGRQTGLYRPKLGKSLSARLFRRAVVGQLWNVRLERKYGKVAAIVFNKPRTPYEPPLNPRILILMGGPIDK